MDRVRSNVQLVPGHRVRVKGRWVAACAGCLAAAMVLARVTDGPGDGATALATVRARPDPVVAYDYDTSAANGALRGVADRIWSSDRYRREMVQSSLLWLVCVPVIVLAFYCARSACCCAPPEARGLYPDKRVPTATATYGSAFSSSVAPAEVVDSSDADDSDAGDLPEASSVPLGDVI